MREKGRKFNWKNHSWKLPQPEEGNRYLCPNITENPKLEEPKEVYTKTYNNKNVKIKDKERILFLGTANWVNLLTLS